MEEKLLIKAVRENARIPKRATEGSAGMDLYACIEGPVTIRPGDLVMIPTGIAIELPSANYVAYLFARSGLGIKHGICLSNGVGVVDSDYRGEIKAALINNSKTDYTVMPGERIAQMMFVPIIRPEFSVTETLSSTERGEGGFGHTGSL
jgi:dUTP pyrophosphatase